MSDEKKSNEERSSKASLYQDWYEYLKGWPLYIYIYSWVMTSSSALGGLTILEFFMPPFKAYTL